jgi:hypothetical protein
MNTFLPEPSFPHSAAALDYKRLGKQRVENAQILRILLKLRDAELPQDMPGTLADMIGARRKVGWQAHPAVRMWRGFEPALALYQTFIIREWQARGYNNTMESPYDEQWQVNPAAAVYCGDLPGVEDISVPAWLGEPVFHAGHRARLLHKDESWYSQFGWREDPSLEYTWPHQLGFEYL